METAGRGTLRGHFLRWRRGISRLYGNLRGSRKRKDAQKPSSPLHEAGRSLGKEAFTGAACKLNKKAASVRDLGPSPRSPNREWHFTTEGGTRSLHSAPPHTHIHMPSHHWWDCGRKAWLSLGRRCCTHVWSCWHVGPTWETQWPRQPASLPCSVSLTQTFRNVLQG